jgi:cobalt-zinc-cadmium efflux system protein
VTVAHGHSHSHAHARGADARRVLRIVLAFNTCLLAVEIAGGIAFSSLALLADAAHQASDVAALVIALIAQALVERPGSKRHTYGLLRAEALAAQLNAVLLIGAAVWVFIEAAERLGSPGAVDGGGVVALASVALLVNLASAVALARMRGYSLNLRGAWLHMVADAAGSAGAILGGIAVLTFDAARADSIASIGIGVMVVVSGWGLLRDTTTVLLEGAPRDLDLNELERTILTMPHVEAVHHLHVWELGTDSPALSVHVVLDGEPSLHDAQTRGNELKAMLAERFGIEHATLELECHDCESAISGLHSAPGSDG